MNVHVSATPCPLGTHRVIEPAGVLPQAAWRLDATPVAHENEILCDVEALNLDSASFRQIVEACDGDAARVAAACLSEPCARSAPRSHRSATCARAIASHRSSR
jgi:hypothetical protein